VQNFVLIRACMLSSVADRLGKINCGQGRNEGGKGGTIPRAPNH